MMLLLLVTCLASLAFGATTVSEVDSDAALQMALSLGSSDPEIDMTTPEVIRHWGYKAEVFNVTTEDGYILEMHRIPYGKSGPGSQPRPVIYLQHGLECSSSNWVTNLPYQSAAYIFADAGYDVWMGNFRGNTYGRSHVTLDPSDSKFWKFSWDEFANIDLKALISTALNISGQDSLYYVGHSEGTMTAFGCFSEDIEFSKKIKKMFMLAPVVTLNGKRFNSPLHFLARFLPELKILFRLVGYNEFLPTNKFLKWFGRYVCGVGILDHVLCANIFFVIAGPNSHQMNVTRIPVYVGHVPAGTSTQNILHFAQMVNSGLFNYYDYGSDSKNQAKYGQPTPPLYPLERMEVPTYIFYGDKDILADVDDVERDLPRFKNLKGAYKLFDYNHADFIYGLRAAPEIYQKILELIPLDD